MLSFDQSKGKHRKKSFIVGDYHYDVETSEDDLDLTFLTAFAIARTEQTFYD